jgi:GTP-sensing pleiotropic transcriptional regulator CodY
LTAQIYAQSPEHGGELDRDETYILMPCEDRTLRPIRMEACRRLTLSEYRMGHLTAIKLMGKINEAAEVMREIGCQILGDEVLSEVEARLREPDED